MRLWSAAAGAGVIALAGAGLLVAASSGHPEHNEGSADIELQIPHFARNDSGSARDNDRREAEIAFYSDRAARDPIGAADRARLAALYLERGRQTATFTDLEQAEAMARASLSLREAHNAATSALLASILMAQHRFAEALGAARRADALEPDHAGHRALVGEILLELGRYDDARAVFDSLRREPLTPAAALRMARWHEITGRPDWAAAELRRILDEWLLAPEPPESQLAWLRVRLADLALKEGRIAAADSQLQAALARAPGDHRVLGALARLDARRGRWRRSIVWGERAITVALDPATLGVLSDAWLALGDSAKARDCSATIRMVALSQPGPPHRVWSLFLLDRGIDVAEVLRRARAELRDRKDVYAYDVYAWALHKSGRNEEAWRAMQSALRMGTKDVQLERHAHAIRAALAVRRSDGGGS